ncbi:MAG: 1-acyl-sn-glycerol-3-phosphate acyltransferase [Deltaproteobacteria bacterium]|nr:1-acyl-sn-glycerol-3-phosphate acyltransferase [Deltaproteobacteria bacterium]
MKWILKIRSVLKVTALFYIVFQFLFLSSLVQLLVWKSHWRRFLQIHWLSLSSRLAIKVLDIHVQVYENEFQNPKSAFIVSNHVSYVDAIILSAVNPCVFVTSHEMREDLFFGSICKLAGCLFVERRNKSNLRGEVSELASVLQAGFSVCVFPEATTGDGEKLLPFRSSLFEGIAEAQKQQQVTSVLPHCLVYEAANGEPLTRELKDSIYYYGEMRFLPQLWKLAALERIEVSLEALGIIEGSDRKELCEQSYQRIRASFEESFSRTGDFVVQKPVHESIGFSI